MVLKEGIQPVEIDFNFVQSGANTFTQVEIELPVNINNQLIFDMDLVEFLLNPANDPIAAGEMIMVIQLTLSSQSAILDWDNNDLIFAYSKRAHASAALLHSGIEEYSLHRDTQGRANFIARDSVFLAIDSTNVTLATRIQGRLIG